MNVQSACPNTMPLEKRVVLAGKYVIIHLKRYLLNDGGWVKDMSLVNCVSEQLSFSVDLDDEVQCRKSYHLVASIQELWLQVTTPLMSCTNRIVSGFCVMIRQCCQYNLQRLTINIAMCFFMSCLNYLIVFFLMFFCFCCCCFSMLSKGG